LYVLSICRLRRTESELEDIYESLEWQRRAARVRGSVVKWNCVPLGIPKETGKPGVPEERAVLKIEGSDAAHPGVVEHLPPIEELPSATLATSVNVAPGPVKNPTILPVALTRARYFMDMYNRQKDINLTYIESRRVLEDLVRKK
jgi:hypothetical protein